MVIQSNLPFAINVTSPTVSKSFMNAASDVLALQIDGSFTSAQVRIEGRITKGAEWTPLAAIDLSTFAAVKEDLTAAGLYEFGVTSVRELRANVISVSGGPITVYGQLISTEEE